MDIRSLFTAATAALALTALAATPALAATFTAKALVSDPKPARETLHFRAELSLGKRIWDAFPSVPRQPTKAVSA